MKKHTARKRFGQNFLTHDAYLNQIVDAIAPQPDDCLLEVGPGLGALTELLLPNVKRYFAIEIDRDLISELQHFVIDAPHFKLFNADALNFDFDKHFAEYGQHRVVGNLPYNIATPLIIRLFDYHQSINDMTFMLQHEVALRLTAKPGDANYGRLSLLAQYFCDCQYLFEVPPEAFDPPPKVMSAIVQLTPYTDRPHPDVDINVLQDVTRTAFSQRRKTLRNNFKKMEKPIDFETLGIDPSLRPEALSLLDYIKIAHFIAK
jgi:16S rRNA (adenine1518-N6/adenine1519-N6)-dimethyltransferase